MYPQHIARQLYKWIEIKLTAIELDECEEEEKENKKFVREKK